MIEQVQKRMVKGQKLLGATKGRELWRVMIAHIIKGHVAKRKDKGSCGDP